MAGATINVPISEELHDHFQRVKNLATAAIADEEESAAGKATTMNVVTAMLKELTKMQEILYTTERIAMLQDAVFEALEEADPELKEKVMVLLEEKLETLG